MQVLLGRDVHKRFTMPVCWQAKDRNRSCEERERPEAHFSEGKYHASNAGYILLQIETLSPSLESSTLLFCTCIVVLLKALRHVSSWGSLAAHCIGTSVGRVDKQVLVKKRSETFQC